MKTLLQFIIFSCFSMTLFGQDYFPLKTGYTWYYSNYEDDVLTDESKVQIIAEEVFFDSLKLYTIEVTDEEDEIDIQFYLENLNQPGQVNIGFDMNEIFLGYSLPFLKHAYTVGETFTFTLYDALVSFQDKITTLKGDEYDDCYTVFVEEGNQSFVQSNNIGLIQVISGDDNELSELDRFTDEIILSTHNVTSNIEITISPNPTSDELQISTDKNDEFQLSIFNLQGQKVLEMTMLQSANIDVSTLSEGQYFIYSSNKRTNDYWLKSFIKE